MFCTFEIAEIECSLPSVIQHLHFRVTLHALACLVATPAFKRCSILTKHKHTSFKKYSPPYLPGTCSPKNPWERMMKSFESEICISQEKHYSCYNALSHGSLGFALHGSSLNHLFIGQNSSTANKNLCNGS